MQDIEKPDPVCGTGSLRNHQTISRVRRINSGRLFFERTQAPGADADLPRCFALSYRLLVQVGLPAALGPIVRVADAMTELSAFAAYVAFSGHYHIPLLNSDYLQTYHVGET
jgi:hypothetical protein